MLTRELISPDKLRGGFYSPDVLVNLCLERASALLGDTEAVRVLEPAAGDGAFVRGLSAHRLGRQVSHLEAVELLDSEAAKLATALDESELPGRAIQANVLEWNERERHRFDLVLANPPYVRFQFMSSEDRQRSIALSEVLQTARAGVSNLWIPVFLLSLGRLVDGGAFSMILPAEFLTGVSASKVRTWLLANTRDLSIDLFEPGSFPAVLQEVLVLSGRKVPVSQASNSVRFYDHDGGIRTWTHDVSLAARTWTSYLLTPEQESAFSLSSSLTGVVAMGSVARFSVATVTGANNYFCVPSSTVEENQLSAWALPMLPRTRHARGITFTSDDHAVLSESDTAAWLLSFSADRPSPTQSKSARAYISQGEAEQLNERYKCRVRKPWYRVPVVPVGELLLSKRSNRFPRVVSNHAGVVTTDTIYRGQTLPGSPFSADDVAASFHNSLTLLTAEVEGRSFGGGVLELVPSEVASLLVPLSPNARSHVTELDALSRMDPSSDALIDATDAMLPKLLPGLTPEILGALREAKEVLTERRFMRSNSNFFA
jgi:adenine-specific DNA-methyltransferase